MTSILFIPLLHIVFVELLKKKMSKLFIVSTPIGNIEDITLRALNVLKKCDFIVCEEYKEARRFLSQYEIEKELIAVNEHNEKEASEEVIRLIKSGKSAAIISDCGTPLFSDPGRVLVDLCIQTKIEIVPVPGASSLMSALVGSGMNLKNFYYYGWLSPKKYIRRKELLDLKKRRELIVLMETPYRLKKITADIKNYFGNEKPVVLAFNLTQTGEKYFRGTAGIISTLAEEKNLKGEFVLLVDNR